MIDYINTTPIVDPVVIWEDIAPFELKRQVIETIIAHTQLVQSSNERYELFASATGASAPTAVAVADTRTRHVAERSSVVSGCAVQANAYASKGAKEAEIDRITSQRVKLMAEKYTSTVTSVEVIARLEILNRRLLDRAPRVSKEQVECLENANEKLMRIRAAREERSNRLGIPV